MVAERHYDEQDAMIYEATYEYDLAGNRTRTVIDGETNVYTLGIGDRLADWETGSYAFDAAGCVTVRVAGATSQTLAWDSLYRLTSVSTNGQTVESYQYDALDRRVKTTTGTSARRLAQSAPHIWAPPGACCTALGASFACMGGSLLGNPGGRGRLDGGGNVIQLR